MNIYRDLFLSFLLISSLELLGSHSGSSKQLSKKRGREISLLDLEAEEPNFSRFIYPNNRDLSGEATKLYDKLKEQVKLMTEEDIMEKANRLLENKKLKHVGIFLSAIPEKIAIKFIDRIELPFLQNTVDDEGLSLPISLCFKACFNILKFILAKYPILVNNSWKNGIHLLHIAIFGNNKELINLLINMNKEILKSKLNSGETVLHLACLNNNNEIIKLLLEVEPDLLEIPDHKGALPLHYGIQKNNIDIVKYFLEKKPDHIKKVDNQNYNCLDFAVISKSLEMVKLIFEKDPTLLNKGEHNNNPFISSLFHELYDIADFFLSKEPDLINWTNKNGYNLLFGAINRKNIKQVEFILNHNGSLVNDVMNGNSLLYKAVRSNCLEIVKMVYEKNPRMVRHINGSLLNPIEIATLNGQRAIIKFFISSDSALANYKGFFHNNLLHVLCQRDRTQDIIWMISNYPHLVYEPNQISILPLQYLPTKKKLIIGDKILFDQYKSKTGKFQNIDINENIFNRDNIYNPRIALLLLQYNLDLQEAENNPVNNNYIISKQLRNIVKAAKLVYIVRYPLSKLAQTTAEIKEQFNNVKKLTDDLLITFFDSNHQKGLRSIQIEIGKRTKNNNVLSNKFLSLFYSPRQIMVSVFDNFYNNKNIVELLKTISKEFNLTQIIDKNKNSLLHHAAFHQDIEVAVILIYLNPALINMKNKNKETPLTMNLLGARLLERKISSEESHISDK